MTTKINNNLNKFSKNFDVTQISKLPNDMINEIRDFLPPLAIVFTNKKNYELHHHAIKKSLDIYLYDSYIKYMIRSDNYIAFNQIVNENYEKWSNISNFVFKHKTYPSYIEYILDYCFFHDSYRCYDILFNKDNQKK
jgi:hypothetical protein